MRTKLADNLPHVMALMMIMMMIITNYAAYTPLQGITFIVMLMHSPTATARGKCRGINKERAGHSGKYLNLFTSDRKRSRRFRMKCILQILVDSNDRVGVHILDGHKWGVLRGKKGTDELKKSEDK